jgi:hypothetical protein
VVNFSICFRAEKASGAAVIHQSDAGKKSAGLMKVVAGKPAGHPSAMEASRGMVGMSRTEKPEGPRSDGDAETSPFAGRRSIPAYVMPEPAAQGTSPSRVVLAVIGIAATFLNRLTIWLCELADGCPRNDFIPG